MAGEKTLVGTSKNSIQMQGVEIKENGEDMTEVYEISYEPGTLTVTDGTDPQDVPVPDEMVVVKDVKEDKVYEVGETVEWTIAVTNIYDEEKKLTVTEKEGMDLVGKVPETIAAGDTVKLTARHVVTEEDAFNGGLASVDEDGVVTAKRKGKCSVYAYAQNGVYREVKVKVK